MSLWQPITLDNPPPENVLVETKIQDEHGERNTAMMYWKKTPRGRMWFFKDGIYPYYNPTHWRKAGK